MPVAFCGVFWEKSEQREDKKNKYNPTTLKVHTTDQRSPK